MAVSGVSAALLRARLVRSRSRAPVLASVCPRQRFVRLRAANRKQGGALSAAFPCDDFTPSRKGMRHAVTTRAASDGTAAPSSAPPSSSTYKKIVEGMNTLFPVWTALAAVSGLVAPTMYTSWMTNDLFVNGLALIMLTMGVTLTFDDMKGTLKKPLPVLFNFASCYLLMPVLAYSIGVFCGLPSAYLAGIVLVGSINGGQASNLCTYVARGDVALSVAMTTVTTFGCIAMTPLIAKLVLGTIVGVDALGIAKSTVQVVLLPIIVGLLLNQYAPKAGRAIAEHSPAVGLVVFITLVGASVAGCASAILDAGWSLQWPLIFLHAIGGILGYFGARGMRLSEKVSRTVAIETAMKSSGFAFILAAKHFTDYSVRVPAAVSVIWMSIVGSLLAVAWRYMPVPQENAANNNTSTPGTSTTNNKV